MSFVIEPGQTLVCLGDSITQASDGYVSIMAAFIAAKYPDRAIKIFNTGIGGNKAPDLWERLERDVIAHRPAWVTVNVGINDVWHGLGESGQGIPLPVYEATVRDIVAALQHYAIRVILVTPTVIGEDTQAEANLTLAEYVAAMHRIAEAQCTLLAPAHADFIAALIAGQTADPEFKMTTDGVHLNAIGNARLALTILETLNY